MQTDLEIFHATIAHQRPSRVLYYAGFVEDLRKRVIAHIGTDDINGHYGFFSPVGVGPVRPADLPPLDFSRYWENDDELPENATINGQGVAMVPSGFYHFWGYISPLRHAKSLKELEDYPLEDVDSWDFSGMADKVRAIHAEGKVAVAGINHIYETAWQIRGLQEFLMDMVERPSWAECLLERLAHQKEVLSLAAARAGADYLLCGDDVGSQQGMMFSIPSWKKMMRSRWERIWQGAKAINPDIKVWYHSDGNILKIVGDLIESGVDILNPLQPECLDIDEIHRDYGDKISFDGTIGTQSTMPFGTPDDVRNRVREVIEKYGKNGGLILSPTHVLEPEVPLENIDAFVEACREFGAR